MGGERSGLFRDRGNHPEGRTHGITHLTCCQKVGINESSVSYGDRFRCPESLKFAVRLSGVLTWNWSPRRYKCLQWYKCPGFGCERRYKNVIHSPPHTVATLRDCPREDWLATHEDWLATGISTSFWRLQNTEHVRSSVPTSCRLQVAQSLHSVRLALGS